MTILKEEYICSGMSKDTIVSSMADILEYKSIKKAMEKSDFVKLSKISPKSLKYVNDDATKNILLNDGYNPVPVVDIVAEHNGYYTKLVHIFGDFDFEIDLPEFESHNE